MAFDIVIEKLFFKLRISWYDTTYLNVTRSKRNVSILFGENQKNFFKNEKKRER